MTAIKRDELAFIRYLNRLNKRKPLLVNSLLGLPIPMIWHAAIRYEWARAKKAEVSSGSLSFNAYHRQRSHDIAG